MQISRIPEYWTALLHCSGQELGDRANFHNIANFRLGRHQTSLSGRRAEIYILPASFSQRVMTCRSSGVANRPSRAPARM